MDRKKVTSLKCGKCNTEQDLAKKCKNCGADFGAFVCLSCRMFDDDLSKEIFHCDKCGICRKGGRDNFFHCDECCACLGLGLRDNHKCVKESLKQNCPVCMQDMFAATESSSVLACGHMLHQRCLRQLSQFKYTCPLCYKSFCDMTADFEMRDIDVENTPMPDEYKNTKIQILCNDCNEPSEVNFHVFGSKCQQCGSYNTRRI